VSELLRPQASPTTLPTPSFEPYYLGLIETLEKTSVALAPGARVPLVERAGTYQLVYAFAILDNPDIWFVMQAKDKARLEFSPRFLYNYGFLCPAAQLCIAKYDTTNNVYVVVLQPYRFLIVKDPVIYLENRSASPGRVIYARADFYHL